MARVKGVSKNSEHAQKKIIAAAIREIGKRGYAGASTERIAERAGYSQATLFFHFKTKSGLLKACLEESRRKAWDTLPDDPGIGVRDLVKRLDDRFDDPVVADFFLKLMNDSRSNNEFRAVYAAYHAEVRGMLRDAIMRETGAEEGRAALAAGAIHCMLIGVHAAHAIESTLLTRADYTAMLARTVDLQMADMRAASRVATEALTRDTPSA